MQEDGGGGNVEPGTYHKLKTYLALTVLLVAVALLSFLIVPQGSGVKVCMSYLLANSKYSCLSSLAVSSLNASVCGYLPAPYADPCYSQVAQLTNSSGTCGRISNATSGYACTEAVATATGNYSLCGGIGEPYAGRCAQGIAVRLDRPSLCNVAGNATTAEECSSIIYIRRMLRYNSSGYCANVTNVANESVANYVIANVTYGLGSSLSGSSAAFESLAFMPNFTYSARDFCYNTAAVRTANAALCADIANAEAASLCSSQLATSTTTNSTMSYAQLIAVCSEYLGSAAQSCIREVEMGQAIATDNASECGSLGSLSDSCFSQVAVKYGNLNDCNLIVNESARAACLNEA
jgi:hypothetical protein